MPILISRDSVPSDIEFQSIVWMRSISEMFLSTDAVDTAIVEQIEEILLKSRNINTSISFGL